MKTVSFNLYSHLHTTKKRILWSRVIYCIFTAIAVDLTVWLMEEVVPRTLENSIGDKAVGVLSGMYVLYVMDLCYASLAICLDLIGAALPEKLTHNHPLLSSSIAEFWGVRWNPIVMKLLQDTFYKPCRRAGMSRTLCVLACFVGSAMLHSFPQYLASFCTEDAMMMGSFFLVQGSWLILESALSITVYEYSLKSVNSTTTGKEKAQITTELKTVGLPVDSLLAVATETATVLSILYGIYLYLTSSATIVTCGLLALLATLAVISFITMHWAMDRFISTKQILRLCFGWFCTLFAIISVLPLFSIPVHNVFGNVYHRSILVGKLVAFLK